MPVLKLPAGGLSACNRNNKGQTTVEWGDWEDEDWVPFWEGNKNDTMVKQNETMDDQNEMKVDQNEMDGREKREVDEEEEEGIFAPLFSKIISLFISFE